MNVTEGELVGIVDFGPQDVLVGMTVKVTSSSERRPRQIGLTVMRMQ